MPVYKALTASFGGTVRQLATKCGVSAGIMPEELAAGIPHPQIVEVTAVWDTGATTSAISQRIVSKLNLAPVGRSSFSTAAGIVEAPVYSANIILPDMEFHAIPVSGNNLGALDMLIGMDIISMGDFHISNHVGRTVMTFRTPSLEKLDYCEELRDARRYRKIHESWLKHGNKRCPCGSGKPWEKCHGIYG